jgi:hypothetical protein
VRERETERDLSVTFPLPCAASSSFFVFFAFLPALSTTRTPASSFAPLRETERQREKQRGPDVALSSSLLSCAALVAERKQPLPFFPFLQDQGLRTKAFCLHRH